ncbi:MAG: hypothetical protein ACR2IE_05000 [Candidatus Sumerlaeaceae bacterium]
MIRKQIYITERQEQLLKRHSQGKGFSEAAMIRHAIDQHLSGTGSRGYDAESWKRARRLIHKRMRLDVTPRKRSWTREDAYEDLMERYGRDTD